VTVNEILRGLIPRLDAVRAEVHQIRASLQVDELSIDLECVFDVAAATGEVMVELGQLSKLLFTENNIPHE